MKNKLIILTATGLMTAGTVLPSTMLSFASAAPGVTGNSTATIKATGLEDSTQGTIYKIIDVTWENGQPKSPQFMWNANLVDWIKANYPNYIAADNSVAPAFNKDLGDTGGMTGRTPTDNGAATFYDALSKAIKKGDATLSGDEFSASNKVATISNKQMGGYLLLFKNDLRVYRPSVVSVYPTAGADAWELASEFAVNVKSTTAPITKTVNTNHGGIGSTRTYTINANIPVYPVGTINKMFNVFDRMSNALTLDASSIAVKGVSSNGNETDLTKDTDYFMLGENANNITSTFGFRFDYERIKQYDKVKITYSATVNRNAAVGTDVANTAIVGFNNDPYNQSSSTPNGTPGKTDEAGGDNGSSVKTYGIDLSKVDGEQHALAGASFSVKPKNGNVINLVKVNDGEYRVADGIASLGAETTVTEAEVNAQGKLLIKGLDKGEYELTETKAPNGYVKLQSPQTVNIVDANDDGTVDDNAAASKGFISVSVVNSKGFTWPITGGQGTFAFAAGGSMVIAAGTVGILYARKKKSNEK